MHCVSKVKHVLADIFLVYLRQETDLKCGVKVAQVSLALILLYAALTLCWYHVSPGPNFFYSECLHPRNKTKSTVFSPKCTVFSPKCAVFFKIRLYFS